MGVVGWGPSRVGAGDLAGDDVADSPVGVSFLGGLSTLIVEAEHITRGFVASHSSCCWCP